MKTYFPDRNFEKQIIQIDDIGDFKFPGKIREMENMIERFYVFDIENVTENDLPQQIRNDTELFSFRLKDAEKQHIAKVLRIFKGNKKQTAVAPEIALNTLKKKIERYRLEY